MRCFENEKLRRFPKSKDVSSRKRPERFSSIVITIYCPCLRPDSYDEMVQCDTCNVWYHYKCVRIHLEIGFVLYIVVEFFSISLSSTSCFCLYTVIIINLHCCFVCFSCTVDLVILMDVVVL